MKTTRSLLVLLVLTIGAHAQDNNAAKLALAREAIAAMHADKMFDGMAAQMKQMATQMAGNALPPQATPEQRKKFEDFQSRSMDLSMESAKGLIAQMDHIYADVYSEAELRAMKNFFASPEGQSMLAKQPQVMAHIMPRVQQMQRDLMPKIKALAEEMKAEIEVIKTKPDATPAAGQP